jgi:hypothetical protein
MTRFALGSDSGRPYGRVRVSLIKLAVRTNRPVYGFRVPPSKSIHILGHDLPLLAASFGLDFSEGVRADVIQEVGISEARPIIQRQIDALDQNQRSLK